MKHWLLIGACALSIRVATADDQVPFTMKGAGGISCGKFINFQKEGNKAQLDTVVQWVSGFISAYNARAFFDVNVRREVSQVRPPDDSTVLVFMGQFCGRASESYVVSGTLALIKDLGGVIAGRPEEIK